MSNGKWGVSEPRLEEAGKPMTRIVGRGISGITRCGGDNVKDERRG